MRVTLDAVEVSTTIGDVAKLCSTANRHFYELLIEAHSITDEERWTDRISVEKAIQYAFAAGVEHGAVNHAGIRVNR